MVRFALCASIAVWTIQPGSEEWRQWRGPGRDGIVRSVSPPATWPERPKQVWTVDAGIGHSSPVVVGNRVFVFSRIGEQEAVTAYDLASGKQVWRQAYDAPYQVNPAAASHGKGPKSTPVVQGGRLFALGISGILSAYDAGSGKVLWRQDFTKEFSNTSPIYGAAMSPIVEGTNVIAHVGGDGGGAIIAFDAATGARKWTWKGDGPAYASPIVATFGGARQMITQTQAHVIALSPADGRELWRIPFTTDYDQNIVTAVAADGLLIYSGLSKPTTAVRPVQKGGKWTTEQVWQNADVPMYMSSPVAAGGILYGLTHRNRGQFFALDLKSGQPLWTSPPRQGDNAALVAAGDLLIATTTDGELVVMRQGRTYNLVREYTLADSPIWAHPAFAGSSVLIKDVDSLSSWRF
jgi:outer membrane protein assembly factor BamB